MTEQLADDRVFSKLIILHPSYHAQRSLIWQYIEDDPASLYVRLMGSQLKMDEIRNQFDEAVDLQLAGLSFSQSPRIVLDESDRADPDDFGEFLIDLLKAAEDTQIIVAGRTIPPSIINQRALRDVAKFVPDTQELLVNSATAQNRGVHMLDVQAFGNGHVHLDNLPVNDWDWMLPRALFFYIVDKGMVTRDDILKTFWPNMTTREATNVFHVTKRKISEVLGMDLTTYSAGFYRLSPDIELNYDVRNFTQLVQESSIVDEVEAIPLLEQAIKLVKGRFLNNLDGDWVVGRREELIAAQGDAIVALADARRNQGQLDEALGLYLRASTTNPHREDIILNIMQLYEQREQNEDALKAYERLESALRRDLGVGPSDNLMRLASSLRSSL